ncbi:MAG: aminotransferase class I/II-fold pyridoxal phosphate-dependent enzyme [Balneolaceae bacterium]|nr:aminotransferase class I/II-fold pyridoxal phosphate-dependent enzyme [Balneolaceae bacterium]MBO6546666.1 aminotransferase class I/II-fold pyridoxal phosphate-dependent enzyme [Balneolaceae bacterium]MBO6649024.1 aminotransferase class I/II-fold pyridoxal phosphate-dependent enzyme [Balneolaceae bacterium]
MGYSILNPGISGLKSSATLAINEKCAQLEMDGRKVYRLGFGQSPFPVPDLIIEGLKEHAHVKNYLPVRGLPQLREAISRHYSAKYNLQIDAANILIGPGSKELLFILQSVLSGSLILPSPSWVSYAPQAQIISKSTVWVETFFENKWVLDPDDLDRALSANSFEQPLLLLNYPNNPTGTTIPEDLLIRLSEVARKHGVLILSDEIYGELSFSGQHQSIAQYYPEGTIISTGISKWLGAGGWRLGLFIVPSELNLVADSMAKMASETFTSASAPIQYAAVNAYSQFCHLSGYIENSISILKLIGDYTFHRLKDMGLRVVQAEGGFYVFPDFVNFSEMLAKKDIFTSEELCSNLLSETGVALLPGSDFGRHQNELTTRLSFVDFDGEKALTLYKEHQGKNQEPEISLLAPNIIEAMDKIQEWLSL